MSSEIDAFLPWKCHPLGAPAPLGLHAWAQPGQRGNQVLSKEPGLACQSCSCPVVTCCGLNPAWTKRSSVPSLSLGSRLSLWDTVEPSFGICFPPCSWRELAGSHETGVWRGPKPTARSIWGRPKPGLVGFSFLKTLAPHAPQTVGLLHPGLWGGFSGPMFSVTCHLFARDPSPSGLLLPHPRYPLTFSLALCMLCPWLGLCCLGGCSCCQAGPGLSVHLRGRHHLVCFLFPTGPSSEVQKEKPNSPQEASELWTHPPEHRAWNQP
ncbi:LOW QUALITY PROTEIN: hypothetical protein MC885_003841 [Smutsia gigantea]|nr:LOW QUALITY PROTEIN: hypothetical protein MC885_003841 [Smutsia gigantea]